jgi:hypothetical protein
MYASGQGPRWVRLNLERLSAMARLTIWLSIGGLVLTGCATLGEMRAATPDARTVAGVPIEKQEAVARCIQDRAYEEIGIMFAIIQETRQEADGWHVIGRASQLPAHITWDVAVRVEVVEVFFSSAPILPRAGVCTAVHACTGLEFAE